MNTLADTFKSLAETAEPPFKADMGYACLLDHEDNLILWFVVDASEKPFAWFYHEEDAVGFAEASNAAASWKAEPRGASDG